MNRSLRHSGRRPTGRFRRGFTLVELLVAVALVVLMMTMFAEIFSLASNAVSTQRGAAVNDQKVRTFTTLLQNDIKSRTFRTVMPFQSSLMPGSAAGNNFTTAFDAIKDQRKGYFSISENDPDDPTDDVLAFTIQVNQPTYGYRDALLYGKAWYPVTPGPSTAHPDVPEFDDGVWGNDQGASTMAEVVWFLRNGNLYRSVRLIRDPYVDHGTDDQPSDATSGTDLFTNNEPLFWSRFDYSAYRLPNTDFPPPDDKVRFHTVTSLDNGLVSGGGGMNIGGVNVPMSLGIPHLRFGHTITGNGGSGAPDEFVGANFIGRWLREEMADSDFQYPGMNGASPAAGGTWNAAKGLVAPYDDTSTRRGEELLVPYVHEFDIQVWDDDPYLPAPMWTDIGAAHTVDGNGDGTYDGFYHRNKNANTTYCPPDRYRFDTWHPQLGSPAPFRGVHPHDPAASPPRTSPDGMPGAAGFNDDADATTDEISPGVADAEEIGWVGSDDERPLRQIRIRVRFYDTKSGQVRQLTLTLPLIDNGGMNL